MRSRGRSGETDAPRARAALTVAATGILVVSITAAHSKSAHQMSVHGSVWP